MADNIAIQQIPNKSLDEVGHLVREQKTCRWRKISRQNQSVTNTREKYLPKRTQSWKINTRQENIFTIISIHLSIQKSHRYRKIGSHVIRKEDDLIDRGKRNKTTGSKINI